MARYRITCILKSGTAHAHITHVGNQGGTQTVAEAVQAIKNGDTYFVQDSLGNQAEVGIFEDRYLRTHADGIWTDNLLALPPCR